MKLIYFDLNNNEALVKGEPVLEQLEEYIGEISSPIVRNSIETILTRLVLIGTMPDEAVQIVRTIWDCTLEELYNPTGDENWN